MRWFFAILLVLLTVCCWPRRAGHVAVHNAWRVPDSSAMASAKDSVSAGQLVAFAKTLIGTPYKFGCTAPSTGFDCSGFIGYVFHHFNIDVPRSSVEFTNEGRTILLDSAKAGDVILFTGTNSKIRTVGHIGLIVAHDTSGIQFIHSSSGAENSVIITQLNEGYMERFVKVVRIRKVDAN
jgi:cell wall-associated NlpC family hydrolase